jgi:cyanuric acid amidohydrolase
MHSYCTAYKIEMSAPDDASQLEELLDRKEFDAGEIVCIICKSEGNGRVNDFSRPLAHRAFRDVISERTKKSKAEIDGRVAFVMSGGCEGVITPHATIFVKRESKGKAPAQKRLSFSMANTRELLPEEVGTETHVQLVAEAVRIARNEARISDLADVHYVQVKCPLLTSERINAAKARGRQTVTEDTTRSMGFSNGASALGIALGLGEISELNPRDICVNPDIFTTRGGSSSGIELMNCQVFVLGNSIENDSPFVSAHHRLDDMIDADGVRKALRGAGLEVNGTLDPDQRSRVLNVFGKAQVPLDGLLRGRRTTLLTDSDLNTRPARAVLGALIASVVGDPAIYASAGWGYHQGPTGGGIAAAIVAVDQPAKR